MDETSLLGDVAGSVEVGLDTSSVLTVQNNTIFKKNVGDVVVAFPAHRANTQTMASITVHVLNGDVVSAGNSYTVVLVQDSRVFQNHVICGRDVEAVCIVSSGEPARPRIRGVSGGVV